MLPNVQAQPDLMQALTERFGDHPVRRFLDFKLIELVPDRCVMTIELKPEFDNTTGAIHGGILSMLADTAAACALSTAFGGEMSFATSSLNIHFLRRANTAVTASATVIKKGSRVCVISVELHDSEQRLVATATCDFVLFS
jgi:uncharacterized protein (TIGR00369 family)